ncbi:hypothetical protein M409DRAFT_23660 [Zasmidium cellare ATCC 36951]|uniref:Uncharacterized protein n=1 Tax=Zasmidium cellare ATCC 36951 TaxID=1080233 RepID=A0A6A6CJP1_ZASCE|nr:uncharacterized protein M409DRAFT_23660 [Zasmidium cellare ATCC 36951]KAF2165929.1 hypothetical protein M409DRAFT_23660 [Zasmidium cellare ATCC 36951]
MDRINSIFLEEALTATSIVFKGDTAAAPSREGTDRYLNALATTLQNLGGKANTVRNNIACPISFEERHPLDFAGHMARWATFHTAIEIQKHHPRLLETYQTLGGSSVETPEAMRKWYTDVQQAAKITFLHFKIDAALSAMAADDASKRTCKLARHNFFAKLHPRRIWLHVKALRNMDRLDPEDFSRQIGPLRCEGSEDEVVRGRDVCAGDLSAALLFTIGRD